MVFINYGSVFDSKCDLLILPCSSTGRVTSWVNQAIINHNLNFTYKSIPYGKVLFINSSSDYEKSNYVGFAASVNQENISSNKEAIESIIMEIILFCRNPKHQCTTVNIPVLGTGAGGLEYSDVIKWYKELAGNINLELHVFIPYENEYILYRNNTEEIINEIQKFSNPRVFISYCRKDKKIENWVVSLTNKLRKNGVDAILDKYYLKPGNDLPQWMTNEIVKAQKVLLICDKNYAERADMRNAGVGWETMIIQGDMLSQGDNNSKYIAIACDGFDKSLPIYVKTKLGISKKEVDEDFNVLLESIFEIETAPELGQIPDWIKEKLKSQISNK